MYTLQRCECGCAVGEACHCPPLVGGCGDCLDCSCEPYAKNHPDHTLNREQLLKIAEKMTPEEFVAWLRAREELRQELEQEKARD